MGDGNGTVAVGLIHSLHLDVRLQLRGIVCGIAGIHVFNIRQTVVREGQGRGGNRVRVRPVVGVALAVRERVRVRPRAAAAVVRAALHRSRHIRDVVVAGVLHSRRRRGRRQCDAVNLRAVVLRHVSREVLHRHRYHRSVRDLT